MPLGKAQPPSSSSQEQESCWLEAVLHGVLPSLSALHLSLITVSQNTLSWVGPRDSKQGQL